MTVILTGEKAKSHTGESLVSGRRWPCAHSLTMWDSSRLGLQQLHFRLRLISVCRDLLFCWNTFVKIILFSPIIHLCALFPFLLWVSHILKYVSFHCSCMCIPVHSPSLPGYINVAQTIVFILTVADFSQIDSTHAHMYTHACMHTCVPTYMYNACIWIIIVLCVCTSVCACVHIHVHVCTGCLGKVQLLLI